MDRKKIASDYHGRSRRPTAERRSRRESRLAIAKAAAVPRGRHAINVMRGTDRPPACLVGLELAGQHTRLAPLPPPEVERASLAKRSQAVSLTGVNARTPSKRLVMPVDVEHGRRRVEPAPRDARSSVTVYRGSVVGTKRKCCTEIREVRPLSASAVHLQSAIPVRMPGLRGTKRARAYSCREVRQPPNAGPAVRVIPVPTTPSEPNRARNPCRTAQYRRVRASRREGAVMSHQLVGISTQCGP